MTYTDETIPVLWDDGRGPQARPTRCMIHPARRFAFYQHEPNRNNDAAIIHVATGAQLVCRCVDRKTAAGWCEYLMGIESDDPDTLRTALCIYITQKAEQQAVLF